MPANSDSPPPLPNQFGADQRENAHSEFQRGVKKPGLIRRWFWSPVKIGENWAQTLLRVLGNLFRIALTLIILMAIALSIAIYISDQNYKSRQEERNQARIAAQAAKPINSVSIRLVQDFLDDHTKDHADGCSDEYPFAVIIENQSDMAITQTWISLSVRRRGTSEILRFRGTRFGGELSDSWVDAEETDTDIIRDIILPNSTHGYCRKFPPEKFLNFDANASYVYSAEIDGNGALTKFSEPEAWMFEELEQEVPQ